jgi:hypothetical protein
MADRIELFERRNRSRIVALVLLATLDDIIVVVMAAIPVGLEIPRRSSSTAGTRSASPTQTEANK